MATAVVAERQSTEAAFKQPTPPAATTEQEGAARDQPDVSSTTQWQSPPSTQRPERLLVVANRLPMTITPPHPGHTEYTFAVSNGGLVSGLRGIKGTNFIWIGWPGTQVPLADRTYVIRECQKCGCHPVFLDRTTIDLFYNGFCNNVLWPLIHYITPPMEAGCNDTHGDQWEAYCRANLSFVEAILEVYEDTDLVWVHDYHLMLVPKLLRARKPQARIGWFLHTPFPSQEMFRMLPYRTELLTGLLSANLVGFHVYDYLRHFLSSCVQLLGLESTAQGIDATPVGGVFVNCSAIPIGIETQQFARKLKDPAVIEAIRRLKVQFGRRKVILGVDRLDYMKGLPHKLNAFDRFLELYPAWNERCVLVQLAVPSRTLVPEYQRLKSTVHELVGMINGRRGNLTHVPVHYLDQSLSFDELVALYRVADVALVTSLRDGMNLVAYEFVACQGGKYGVLILSEFAGAAQSLGAGSIRINPWNLDETAEAIHRALSMSKAERRSRHDYAMNHIRVHTSQKWAEIFIESLRDASERSEQVRASVPPPLEWFDFLDKFRGAKRRLIVVDLLDALTPARGNRGIPMKRFKRLIHLPRSVIDALNTLSQDPSVVLIVTTPHPPATLERLFADTRICLAAEKGCLYRNRNGEWIRFIEERVGSFHQPASVADTHRASIASSSSFTTALLSQKGAGGKSESGTPRPVESSPALGRAGPLPLSTVWNEWSPGVEKVMEFFQTRTPGSYTERTTGTLTWYWDDTLPDFGKQQSRDLLVHLWTGPLANASSADVEVVVGSRFIEVRSPLSSRVKLLQRILEHEFGSSQSQPDFVVCIGNFPRRDEDVHTLFEQPATSLVPRENSMWSELSSASPPATANSSSFDGIDSTTGGEATPVQTGRMAMEAAAMDISRRASFQKSTAAAAEESPRSEIPLGLTYYSISVGVGLVSRARYCLPSTSHVQALVRDLALCFTLSPDIPTEDIVKFRYHPLEQQHPLSVPIEPSAAPLAETVPAPAAPGGPRPVPERPTIRRYGILGLGQWEIPSEDGTPTSLFRFAEMHPPPPPAPAAAATGLLDTSRRVSGQYFTSLAPTSVGQPSWHDTSSLEVIESLGVPTPGFPSRESMGGVLRFEGPKPPEHLEYSPTPETIADYAYSRLAVAPPEGAFSEDIGTAAPGTALGPTGMSYSTGTPFYPMENHVTAAFRLPQARHRPFPSGAPVDRNYPSSRLSPRRLRYARRAEDLREPLEQSSLYEEPTGRPPAAAQPLGKEQFFSFAGSVAGDFPFSTTHRPPQTTYLPYTAAAELQSPFRAGYTKDRAAAAAPSPTRALQQWPVPPPPRQGAHPPRTFLPVSSGIYLHGAERGRPQTYPGEERRPRIWEELLPDATQSVGAASGVSQQPWRESDETPQPSEEGRHTVPAAAATLWGTGGGAQSSSPRSSQLPPPPTNTTTQEAR